MALASLIVYNLVTVIHNPSAMTRTYFELHVERAGIIRRAISLAFIFTASVLSFSVTPSLADDSDKIENAVERIQCSLNLETPAEADIELGNAIANILTENGGRLSEEAGKALAGEQFAQIKSEKSIYEQAWMSFARKKIQGRVLAICKAEGGCTYESVMRLTHEEFDRLLLKKIDDFRSRQGYAVMIGLTAASIWLSGKALAYMNVPEETRIIISGMVGGYIAMLRAPVDIQINKVGQRAVNKIWGYFKPKPSTPGGQSKPNLGFAKTFQQTLNMYTGDEGGGRNDIICTVNDIIPRFLDVSSYLNRTTSLTHEEKSTVAYLFARNLYQMRVFHRGIDIDNPQFSLLMVPTTRQYSALFEQVKPLVWGVLHQMEITEARVNNNIDYNHPLLNTYYQRLIHKWFEEALPTITPRYDLLSP